MSGLVISPTGSINFNSNASSTAVRQVFGEASSNMQGLSGSNVDDGTRPPPFTALTVPTAASGNLKLSYFAGKSLFLASPSAPTISNITTTTVTPGLSGGGGTSYRFAVGTSSGAFDTVGWRTGVNNTQVTSLAFTVGSSYYISAHSSNATNSTASLAVSNATAFGIPGAPTAATITLTTLSNWSVGWTAPTGIAPTGYTWSISNVSDGTTFTGPSNTASTSASGTTTLLQDKNYTLYVLAYRTESTSGNATSSAASLASPAVPSAVTVSAITTTNYTPSITGGGSGTKYVTLGTASGGTAPATSWTSGAVTQTSVVGTSYYISAKISNTTTGTTSATVTSSAVGIPNVPTSPTLTLTNLSSWSVSWTTPTGIAPTGYTWSISNTSAPSLFVGPSNTVSTSASGTTTLLQDTNYALYVLSTRPEASSTNATSSTVSLVSPAAPSAVGASSITTAGYTPTITGGGTGTTYVIIGTVAGGSAPTTSWTNGAVAQTLTTGTSYYVSAKISNATTYTTSATVTSSAVGIPNVATGVTLTITTLSNWSFLWTAPATGISPTGYSWYLNTVNNSTSGAIASGTTTSGVTTGAQTTALAGSTTYYGIVYATRPESISAIAASSGVTSPAAIVAPTNFVITSMTTTIVNFSWTAVSGATSYTLTYSGTSDGSVTSITGTTYQWTHGLADGAYTCTLAAVASGTTGPSSGAAYFAMFRSPTTTGSYTAPVGKSYVVTVSGAAGGAGSHNGSYYGIDGAGGNGSLMRGTVTLSAGSYAVKIGGMGGASTAGSNGGGIGGYYSTTGLIYGGGGGGFSQFGIYNTATSILAGGGGGGATFFQDSGSSYALYSQANPIGPGASAATTASPYDGIKSPDQNSGTFRINNPDPEGSGYGDIYANASGAPGGRNTAPAGPGAGANGDGQTTRTNGTAGSTTTGGNGGTVWRGTWTGSAGGGGGGGFYGAGGGSAAESEQYDSYVIAASGGGSGSSYAGAGYSYISSSTGSAGNGYVYIYG